MENAIIALTIGFFVILIVLPILALILLTVFDVIFRVDIDISKLFWLAAVLFVPVGGMLLYWLFRPKDFNPLLESTRPSLAILNPGEGDLRHRLTREQLTVIESSQPEAGAAVEEAPAEVERKAA